MPDSVIALLPIVAFIGTYFAVYGPLEAHLTQSWIRRRLKPEMRVESEISESRLPLADRIDALAREIQAGGSPSLLLGDFDTGDCDPHLVTFVDGSVRAAAHAGPGAVMVLQSVSETIRRQQAAQQMATTQASTALLSARVLTWLPMVAGTFLCLTDERVRGFILGSKAGWLCLVFAGGLNGTGWLLMRRLLARPIAQDPILAVVDAYSVGLAATGSTHDAIRWAFSHGNARHLDQVCNLIDMGGSTNQVLDQLQSTLGAESAPFVAALRAHHRDGLPIKPTLERIRTFALARQERAIESQARRLPVRMSFPLVFCVLPAFALVTIVPLIAGAVSTLSSPI